jgi:hypothetical protein
MAELKRKLTQKSLSKSNFNKDDVLFASPQQARIRSLSIDQNSLSLEMVLKTPTLLNHFRKMLKRIYAEENLIFFYDIHTYRQVFPILTEPDRYQVSLLHTHQTIVQNKLLTKFPFPLLMKYIDSMLMIGTLGKR